MASGAGEWHWRARIAAANIALVPFIDIPRNTASSDALIVLPPPGALPRVTCEPAMTLPVLP
jgi:hypothetical protein